MDLGVRSLDEVVELAYHRKIISEELYVEYVANYTQEKINEFINAFIQNDLTRWDFVQFPITIIDHRRLTQILVRLFPKTYQCTDPRSMEPLTNQFLVNLYEMVPSDFNKLLELMDRQSQVTFWKTIHIRCQKMLAQNRQPTQTMPLASNKPTADMVVRKRPSGRVLEK